MRLLNVHLGALVKGLFVRDPESINITHLRSRLRDFINLVAGGRRIVIEVAGRPVAALVGLEDFRRIEGRSSPSDDALIALAAATDQQLSTAILMAWLSEGVASLVVDGRVIEVPKPDVHQTDWRSIGPGPASDRMMAAEPSPSYPYSVRSVGKYAPLRDWLLSRDLERVEISFPEVQSILGAPLPHSALRRSSWWTGRAENSPTQVHKRAWTEAGYEVESVDMNREVVVFRRSRGG